jgi:hypothetical protein
MTSDTRSTYFYMTAPKFKSPWWPISFRFPKNHVGNFLFPSFLLKALPTPSSCISSLWQYLLNSLYYAVLYSVPLLSSLVSRKIKKQKVVKFSRTKKAYKICQRAWWLILLKKKKKITVSPQHVFVMKNGKFWIQEYVSV